MAERAVSGPYGAAFWHLTGIMGSGRSLIFRWTNSSKGARAAGARGTRSEYGGDRGDEEPADKLLEAPTAGPRDEEHAFGGRDAITELGPRRATSGLVLRDATLSR